MSDELKPPSDDECSKEYLAWFDENKSSAGNSWIAWQAAWNRRKPTPEIAQARVRAFEEAARTCDELARLYQDEGGAPDDCAAAIRALAAKG